MSERIPEPTLTWEETVAFLRKCGPVGKYVKKDVIAATLSPPQPNTNIFRAPQYGMKEKPIVPVPREVIIKGIAIMVGMVSAGFSTPEMIQAARGKPCPYCTRTMEGNKQRRPSRDHIKARVNGGTLRPGNCLIVCQGCNGDKDTHTLDQWLAILRRDGDGRAAIVEALIVELKKVGWQSG